MGIQKPTVVIFDMDGTTVRHLNPFILSLCENFDDISYKISKFFGWIFFRNRKGPIIPVIEEAERQKRKPQRLLVHRTIHTLRRKPVDQIVEPCPNVREVLEYLAHNDIPMAMVSNGLGKGYGHDVLQKFNLAHFFRVTLFREDIHKSKPNPEPILLALRDMDIHLKPSDVIWYIGDRRKDVLAALSAHQNMPCPVIPIAYGMNAAAAIIEKGLSQEHILMDYTSILNVLKNAFKTEIENSTTDIDDAESTPEKAPTKTQAT